MPIGVLERFGRRARAQRLLRRASISGAAFEGSVRWDVPRKLARSLPPHAIHNVVTMQWAVLKPALKPIEREGFSVLLTGALDARKLLGRANRKATTALLHCLAAPRAAVFRGVSANRRTPKPHPSWRPPRRSSTRWKSKLTSDQKAFARRSVESNGRLHSEEEAVREALALWEERERRRLEFLTTLDRARAPLPAAKAASSRRNPYSKWPLQ